MAVAALTVGSGARALVTGATGFVGGHLVEALLQAGDTVRCLVRARSNQQWLPDAAERVQGGVGDPPSLARAVTGVDIVYHLAAVTSTGRPADYDRVNRGGVVHVLDAMARHAPNARLVLCSSLAAGGPVHDGRPLTEDVPAAPIGPYGESKANAERTVAASSVPSVIVRPPAVYGPRDHDILSVFRLARAGIVVRTGPVGQRLAMIHVKDLAQGLMAAGHAGPARGIYYVNGGNHIWEDIVTAIESAVGRRLRIVALPAWALIGVSHLARAGAAVTGWKPLLTPERARDLIQADWTCDDARARRELGFRPQIPLADGLRQTAEWYRAQGWLRSSS